MQSLHSILFYWSTASHAAAAASSHVETADGASDLLYSDTGVKGAASPPQAVCASLQGERKEKKTGRER